MTRDDLERAVKAYIVDAFLPGETVDSLLASTHLVDTGIVRSVHAIQLVDFVETSFDVEIRPKDVYRMVSVVAIADLVEELRGGAATA